MSTNCENCEWKLQEFFPLIEDIEKLYAFLQRHGCILPLKKCPQCGELCSLGRVRAKSVNLFFRCQRSKTIVKHNKKRIVKCNFVESVKKNPFFAGSHLSIPQICKFIYIELLGVVSPHKFLMEELDLSSRTIVDWRSFMREVFVDWAAKFGDGKLGGPDRIVEIDELEVGKRKNNCGRIIEDSRAHTQHIEGLWRKVKSEIHKCGRRKTHLLGYLCEFVFKNKFDKRKERVHHFFSAMGSLYDPTKQLNLDEEFCCDSDSGDTSSA